MNTKRSESSEGEVDARRADADQRFLRARHGARHSPQLPPLVLVANPWGRVVVIPTLQTEA